MAPSSRHLPGTGLLLALCAFSTPLAAEGGSIGGAIEPDEEPRGVVPRSSPPPVARGRAYSFPVNTSPDGWAALKAAPDMHAPRLARVYDGTLFTVVGYSGRWAHVRLASGETGWIIGRLVGCCR